MIDRSLARSFDRLFVRSIGVGRCRMVGLWNVLATRARYQRHSARMERASDFRREPVGTYRSGRPRRLPGPREGTADCAETKPSPPTSGLASRSLRCWGTAIPVDPSTLAICHAIPIPQTGFVLALPSRLASTRPGTSKSKNLFRSGQASTIFGWNRIRSGCDSAANSFTLFAHAKCVYTWAVFERQVRKFHFN